MNQIKAPSFVNRKLKTVFLAGSIEMGAAENWQDRVARLLEDTNWTVLNPRRDDWDNSWEQKISHPAFNEQVSWELQGLESSDMVIVYFDPNTKAPITLLEFGLLAGRSTPNMLVICPEGFYRKGNVDIVCERYRIKQCSTLEEACETLRK